MRKNRTDMAFYIKEHKDCTLKDAELSAFFAVEWLLNAVASGECVELRGFGTFYTVEKAEYKSNLGMIVPKQCVVRFRPSEALKRLCKQRKEIKK